MIQFAAFTVQFSQAEFCLPQVVCIFWACDLRRSLYSQLSGW